MAVPPHGKPLALIANGDGAAPGGGDNQQSTDGAPVARPHGIAGSQGQHPEGVPGLTGNVVTMGKEDVLRRGERRR
jgi:hypothetical protein